MIKVITRGGSADQRKAVNSIARFAAHKLMSKRLADSLTVRININKDLFAKEGVYGDIEPLDHDSRRPKDFRVRADGSMRLRPLLETIAHEMVHVKQYARDEMREVRKAGLTVNRFNGKYYPEWMNYWEQPWEIEAHGREKGLFEMWADATEVFKFPKENAWAFEDHYPPGYLDKI